MGERGPELVNLPGGSSVRPSLGGIGGGGISINVYGNIDNEITVQTLANEIRNELFDAERRGLILGEG